MIDHLAEQDEMQATPEVNGENISPSIIFESITFSDTTTIALDPEDVVVLVGPNNSGKSAALRELEGHFSGNRRTIVLDSLVSRISGTKEEFQEFVTKHANKRFENGSYFFSGYQWALSGSSIDLPSYWPNNLTSFKPMFCLRLQTESRIKDSDPPSAINTRAEALAHPIHILLDDDELEIKISKYFREAFDDDLILDRTPARTISLLVGNRPVPDSKSGEDRLTKSYRERVYARTIPLLEQGDGMRSFASVILHLLAPTTASVLLLDEPEAFLHPPQARLLGKIIAAEKSPGSQLFVATHSPDVLQGLIDAGPERLRVLRMQRDGAVNRIKELDKERVKQISSDPLMNYSSVLSGVFHERVIICESDADCMFYRSILDIPGVRGNRPPDVLFVHASGKDRMAALASTLVALDVPVDIVADIDAIRDETGLRKIIDALGGDWSAIEPAANTVRMSVDNGMPRLSIHQTREGIRNVLDNETLGDQSEQQLKMKISSVFRSASPWDTVKHNGESAFPAGDATQQFQRLQELCREVGLWIVPVGEMEGFCRSIGGHGPGWVQQVIGDRNLTTDPDLERARQFVRELWESRQEISS